MVARIYEIYLRVFKSIERDIGFEHEKINFIYPSNHVLFCYYMNLLITMFLTIFRRFPTDFRRFLKFCPKVVRVIPNIFRNFPKIAKKDPKMFRLNIDKLWLIEHSNIANSASWLVKNDIKCVNTIFIHKCVIPWYTIFLDLLPLATPLQFI